MTLPGIQEFRKPEAAQIVPPLFAWQNKPRGLAPPSWSGLAHLGCFLFFQVVNAPWKEEERERACYSAPPPGGPRAQQPASPGGRTSRRTTPFLRGDKCSPRRGVAPQSRCPIAIGKPVPGSDGSGFAFMKKRLL